MTGVPKYKMGGSEILCMVSINLIQTNIALIFEKVNPFLAQFIKTSVYSLHAISYFSILR